MRVPLNVLLEEIDEPRNLPMKAQIRRLIPRFAGFTFAGYEEILKSLARSYSVVPFRDYRAASGPKLVLRHDIEGFMEPAVRMARIESKLDIHSTYFVLLSSRLYNPAEKAGFEALTEISRLGHEIGLHYDVSRYLACGRPPKETLEVELRFLGNLLGEEVTAISRHNPSIQSFANPFAGMTDLMSAYDDEFTVDAHYVSDSCRAWYLDDLLYIFVKFPEKVQLLVHPENWTTRKVTRYTPLDLGYAQLQDENQTDMRAWKNDWRTSERVPLYEKHLKAVKARLF